MLEILISNIGDLYIKLMIENEKFLDKKLEVLLFIEVEGLIINNKLFLLNKIVRKVNKFYRYENINFEINKEIILELINRKFIYIK